MSTTYGRTPRDPFGEGAALERLILFVLLLLLLAGALERAGLL